MPVGFGKEWVIKAEDIEDIEKTSGNTASVTACVDEPEDIEPEDDFSDEDSRRETHIDIKAAKDKALWLLSRQDYSVKCMREKLLDKGASPEDADKVIEYLKGLSYLDDERFARSYVRTHSNISRLSLKQKLYRKGVDSDITESAIADSYTGDTVKLISDLARKKHFDMESADYESTCKFKAYLYRRGFSTSEIRRFFEAY